MSRNRSMPLKPHPLTQRGLVFFYALSALLSVFAQVMGGLLEVKFSMDISISPQGLGLLAAIFFVFLALSLIPVGILSDRWGPKGVQSILLWIGGIGAVIFATAGGYVGLFLGRILLGIGMSGGLVTGLKAVKQGRDESKFHTYNMIIIGFASVGGALATKPLDFLLDHMSWRLFMGVFALLLFVLALLFFLYIPNVKPNESQRSPLPLDDSFKSVLRSKSFWKLLLLSSVCFGSFLSNQTLWSVEWLRRGLGFSQDRIALYLLIMSLGVIVGLICSRVFLWIGSKIQFDMESVVGFFMIFFILFQILLIYRPIASHFSPWFFYGFFASVIFLSLTVFARLFSTRVYGKVVTFFLLMVYGVTFAFQSMTGLILSLWHAHESLERALHGFHMAFWVVCVVNLAILVWFFTLYVPTASKDSVRN